MPLQRSANHGFSEAATQFRRYHAWSSHDTILAAASSQSSSSSDGARAGDGFEDASPSINHLRRPSMRPLDSRWDRSRGIVFSCHNQRRTYASKPIQRSTPASKPANAPTKSFGPSSAASAVDSGWKGGPYGNNGAGSGYSFKQGKDLEKKNSELNNEIRGLQTMIKDQKARMEAQEGQMALLKNQVTNLDNKLDRAQWKAQRDLRDLHGKHERELESLGARTLENKAYLEDFERKTQAPLLEQIDRLSEARLKDQRESQGLKTAMEEQQKRHETTQRNAVAHSRDLSIALDKAAKEIQGFRSRKQEDRKDYTRYQTVFSDLNDKIFQARDEIRFARRRVDDERTYWQKSKRKFQTSDNLRLFLHSSKYTGTKKAVEEYLAEQVAQAKTTTDGLRQLEVQLTQGRFNMQPVAHESRALTRHHHFDEHQSAYNGARLSQRLATSVPFQDLRKAYTQDIEHLRTLIDESTRNREGGDVVERMKSKMEELKDARRKVQRFLTFFGYVQDWRALEALQADDIVEQAVWVDSIKARQSLETAVERFYDEIEDQPVQNTEDWNRRNDHREDVRVQRMELEYLVAQVRQRHLLAHDLGKMTKEEQSRVEQTIKRQTELAKSAVDGSLAGLGFQKPSARRTTTIQNSGEAVVSRIKTSDKPVPSIETLRANLSAKIATKKKRNITAENKSTVLKKSPRKSKIGRSRISFSGRKQFSLDHPSENLVGGVAHAMREKAKGKVDVSAAGVSGLKPTESRQSQWRQPAYETEVDSPKTGSRCSRGDNMRFSTVKAALTQSGEGMEEPTEKPVHMNDRTAVVDDFDLSASEDSASSFDENSSDAEETVPEELQTVLSYQIPPKDYRAAVMASQNSNAAYWTYNLYKNAEDQKPVVYYCQSYDSTEARAKLFLNEPVLGFDMEWESRASIKADQPDIKRNVSLIQIAAEDKIGLFQLARFRTAKTAKEHMPPSLRKILESPDIVKAGVNISGDAKRLNRCVGVEMKGIFELSHMFRIVKQSEKFPVSFRQVSLTTQVQEVLHLPLKKDDVRVSAWSRELNTQQTSYAATDAYAGFQLFHRLDNARKVMKPKPPRPAFYESWQPLDLGDGTMVLRSSDASGRKRTVVKKGDEVVGEEAEVEDEEEYFDAPEGLDTYQLSAEPEISGSIPNPEDPDVLPQNADFGSATTRQEISYPSLPIQDRAFGNVADSPSIIPAPSQTTTLPIRAKLTSKTTPQNAGPIPHPDEEEIQFDQPALQTRPGPLPCPEVQAAETWIISHCAKYSNVGTPTLRAYHLWHYQKFELREVAGFCRDPPLAITTVASYVMQALKEAGLPFDEERVKGVLSVLPGSVHERYRGVLEKGRRERS